MNARAIARVPAYGQVMYRHGIDQLDLRIASVREALARRGHIERMLVALKWERVHLEHKVGALKQAMEDEQDDVARLRGAGLSVRLYRLLGLHTGKLDKEREQAAHARLRYEEARAELAALSERERELSEELVALDAAEDELSRLVAQKQAWLTAHDGPDARELFAIAEQLGGLSELIGELDQALSTGVATQRAMQGILALLDDTDVPHMDGLLGLEKLPSISGQFGANEARQLLPTAQAAASRFERECADVAGQVALDAELQFLSRFADSLLDRLVRDSPTFDDSRAFVATSLGHLTNVLDALIRLRAPRARQRDQLLARRDQLLARDVLG